MEKIAFGDYEAVINLKRGANCISLRNGKYNAEILREPDYEKGLDNPYLYGMPVLFPVNRISGGEFEFEGRKYVFPVNEPNTNCHLHGVLHETEFKVLEKTESKIVCLYQADKEEYLNFPHGFEVKLSYELTDDGFSHKTEITNLSEENMPLFIGFHTTFNSCFAKNGNKDDVFVLIQLKEEFERNMTNYLPTGLKPEFDDVSEKLSKGMFNPFEKPISRHYRASGNKMVIYDKGNDLSLVYENDEKFGFRLIYNGNADEYICLEPQTCLANCQNSPFDRKEAGFDYIKPKETKTYYSKIYIAEGDKR